MAKALIRGDYDRKNIRARVASIIRNAGRKERVWKLKSTQEGGLKDRAMKQERKHASLGDDLICSNDFKGWQGDGTGQRMCCHGV